MCIRHKSRRGVRKEEGEDRKDDGRCMCVTTRTCACHNEVLILCAHQGRKRNTNIVTFNSQCWPGAAATGSENEDPGGGRSGGASCEMCTVRPGPTLSSAENQARSVCTTNYTRCHLGDSVNELNALLFVF